MQKFIVIDTQVQICVLAFSLQFQVKEVTCCTSRKEFACYTFKEDQQILDLWDVALCFSVGTRMKC